MDIPNVSELLLLEEIGAQFPSSFRKWINSSPESISDLDHVCPSSFFIRTTLFYKKLSEYFGPDTPFFVGLDRTDISGVTVNPENMEFDTKFELYAVLGSKEIFPDIYLFQKCDKDTEPRIAVFRVHTTVHEWNSFSDWIEWVRSRSAELTA